LNWRSGKVRCRRKSAKQFRLINLHTRRPQPDLTIKIISLLALVGLALVSLDRNTLTSVTGQVFAPVEIQAIDHY